MLIRRKKNLKRFRGFINRVNYISHMLYIILLEEHKNVNISWLFSSFLFEIVYSQSMQDLSIRCLQSPKTCLRQNKRTVKKRNLENYCSLTLLSHSLDLFSIATEQNNLYIQSH